MEPGPGGYPRRPVIRTYRSGCGCFPTILALPVIVAIAVIVVFLLTRGDETRSTAACDLFSRSFDLGREAQLTEFELVGVLGDIQGLAESANAEVRDAAEELFIASQSQDASQDHRGGGGDELRLRPGRLQPVAVVGSTTAPDAMHPHEHRSSVRTARHVPPMGTPYL